MSGPETLPANPYRGLAAYRYDDHAIFFGREPETRRLEQLVSVYRAVPLFGASGTGKSSLVNAGLLPLLAQSGFRAARVRVSPDLRLTIDAGVMPDPGAAAEVLIGGADSAWRAQLTLDEFSDRLPAVADRLAAPNVRPSAGPAPILLVFDQFEEVFTLLDGAPEWRDQLVDLLIGMMRESLPVKILLVFREDCLGLVWGRFGGELMNRSLRIAPIAASALPSIIRAPFDRWPHHFPHELSEPLAARLAEGFARLGPTEAPLTEVQLVCNHLWMSADPEAILEQRGIFGILQDIAGDWLAPLPPPLEAAAVAILRLLVTSSGTRNVLAGDDLLRAVTAETIIEPHVVDEALHRLERDTGIVRSERRRDLVLYELASEWLIPWIMQLQPPDVPAAGVGMRERLARWRRRRGL